MSTPPDLPTPPTPSPRDRPPSPGAGYRVIGLLTAALAVYFGTLWLGVVVIGDTTARSAVMAALILAIAATGWYFNHRPVTPSE